VGRQGPREGERIGWIVMLGGRAKDSYTARSVAGKRQHVSRGSTVDGDSELAEGVADTGCPGANPLGNCTAAFGDLLEFFRWSAAGEA
jgi:hypothetical protein